MRVLVTGGTGMLGEDFARLCREAGHTVRIMSRRERPEEWPGRDEWVRADLVTGEGLGAAVAGVDVVLHGATSGGFSGYEEVDLEGSRKLLDCLEDSPVGHLIYPSIVGVDEIPLGYYRTKHRVEQEILASTVPATVIRVTQFHALLDSLFQALANLPLMPVPRGFRIQSVAGVEVAAELLDRAAGPALGRAPDFAGPNVLELQEMARTWTRARERRHPVLPLPLPGKAARAFREGKATHPARSVGRKGWREWLAGRAT